MNALLDTLGKKEEELAGLVSVPVRVLIAEGSVAIPKRSRRTGANDSWCPRRPPGNNNTNEAGRKMSYNKGKGGTLITNKRNASYRQWQPFPITVANHRFATSNCSLHKSPARFRSAHTQRDRDTERERERDARNGKLQTSKNHSCALHARFLQ